MITCSTLRLQAVVCSAKKVRSADWYGRRVSGDGVALNAPSLRMLDSRSSLYTSLRRSPVRRRSLVQSVSRRPGLLLNSMGVITRSQHAEESALLRCRIDELNKNTVILIAQAEKLIQESEKLSVRVKALENA